MWPFKKAGSNRPTDQMEDRIRELYAIKAERGHLTKSEQAEFDTLETAWFNKNQEKLRSMAERPCYKINLTNSE